MGLPMEPCPHDRVVRLVVPGTEGPLNYWLCNQCNAQFVAKDAVDWKIAHLTAELSRRMLDELTGPRVNVEQAAGMRAEESI